jgi:protein-S-isoprenylcysteine O-methyltransferase Ste14
VRKAIVLLFGAATAVIGLFCIAGTVAWWNAWVFLVFITVLGAFTSRLIRNLPGLAEERRTAAAKARPWDLKLVKLINLALPAMVVVAAFSLRFRGLPDVPVAVSVAAFAAMIPAVMLTYRAIAANAFFSSHIRIQEDRGHYVVSAGPYGFVRHPGYAGSILFNLLVPLALGSWAALAPGFGAAVLLAYRTAKEDRVLLAELGGYAAYAQQVTCRLIPGVW